MDAVQVMRQRAEASGNLKTTPQQIVTTQGPTIVVEPADPEIVYVPAYDPWLVYGLPLVAWPGWYPYPGIWYGGPYLFFGPGYGIGWFGHYGWGWGHWGFDWHNRYPIYDHRRYYSQSTTFYNRNEFYRDRGGRGGPGWNRGEPRARNGGEPRPGNIGGRGGVENRPSPTPRPFGGNPQAARGYAEPHGESGVHSGAFSGYEHGGETRSYSSRGGASFGGGAPRGGAAPAGGGGRR